MNTNTEDYLKKELLNSTENAHDFIDISRKVQNPELKQFLLGYAETEDMKAKKIMGALNENRQKGAEQNLQN